MIEPSVASNGFTREREMSALVDEKLQAMSDSEWRIRIPKSDRSVGLREQVDKVAKILLIAKDMVQPAVNLDPIHAGFPLMGACILLQVR